MSLPAVKGWIIDFRTARNIFASGSNAKIAHCVDLCAASKLFISHCEEKLFRGNPQLKGPFLVDQKCVYEPDDDIFERCPVVNGHPSQKKRLIGNEAAVFITATALAKNFGVISDHVSPVFATVHDLCDHYGVPVFSADDYFELALP